MSGLLSCPGELSIQGGTPVCSVDWASVPYVPPFDPSQLDPVLLGQAFGVGFSIVASCIVLSIPVRAIVNFIKSM